MNSDNSGSGQAGGTDSDAAVGGDDDVKEKFRQALERKRGSQADREASGDRIGSSKVNEQRAAAKTKRTFRRKSG
jgi:hypothetical protein